MCDVMYSIIKNEVSSTRAEAPLEEYKKTNYSVQFLAFSCKKVVNLKQTNTAKLSDLNNELDHALLREKFVKNYSFLTMHFLLYFAHSYV